MTIPCPACSGGTRVLRSRLDDDGVYVRIRRCVECRRRCMTTEVVAHADLAHGNRTLRACDVQEMRAAYAAGTNQTELAGRYGVSQNSVSQIVQRKTYKEVE